MKNLFKRRSLAQQLADLHQCAATQPVCLVHISTNGVLIIQVRPVQVAARWADLLLQAQRQQVIQRLEVAPELVHEVLVVSDQTMPLNAANMCYLSQLDEFIGDYSLPLFKPREVKALLQQWQQQQPQCSACESPMQLQIRQHGQFAGRLYYSCRQFPSCRQLIAAD